MGSGKEKVKWFKREIVLDDIYYVYFSDKKREMTAKQREEYDKINKYPDRLKWKSVLTMDPLGNPNVKPMSGRELMDAAAKGYIPQFDAYFAETHRLTLMPAQGMEYFMKRSFILNG